MDVGDESGAEHADLCGGHEGPPGRVYLTASTTGVTQQIVRSPARRSTFDRRPVEVRLDAHVKSVVDEARRAGTLG